MGDEGNTLSNESGEGHTWVTKREKRGEKGLLLSYKKITLKPKGGKGIGALGGVNFSCHLVSLHNQKYMGQTAGGMIPGHSFFLFWNKKEKQKRNWYGGKSGVYWRM